MREIKFRAWDGKMMRQAFDLSQNPKYYWDRNKDYPLLQYTGLKDKNGVEIYEGDIVRLDNRAMMEGIRTNWNGNLNIEVKIEINRMQCSWEFFSRFGEVIGNIYENPELLEDNNGQ